MLRRPATEIKLTPEDILEYDDSLVQDHSHNDKLAQQSELQEQINNSSELITEFKSRDERVGVTRDN